MIQLILLSSMGENLTVDQFSTLNLVHNQWTIEGN